MAKQTEPTRVRVDRPTQDAERNRKLANQTDPTTDGMLLPSLDDGITLLDVEEGRGVPVLQSLVLDHLLEHGGPAFWIDANGHATTTTLARIAPSQRLLDRIHVARGFTAYQHYSAVSDLSMVINRTIQRSLTDEDSRNRQSSGCASASKQTPAVIVAPAVDAQYRTDDSLREPHAETLQARTLARLATYAEGYDIPVLVTRSERDTFTAPVETAADHYLQCKQTRMGPRFVGEDFETLVYPNEDGTYYQTTFAYWRQMLEARAAHVGMDAQPANHSPPEGVGTGITADGETVAVTADPLHGAWTATSAGGR